MDWAKIRTEYIAGGISYRELAKKHGVSFNTLKTRAVEGGWSKLRQLRDHKATTKAVETLSSRDAKTTVDIIGVADRILTKIEEVLGCVATPQDIRHLTSALKDLKDIKGIKSEADIREQEARIAKLQKDAQAEEEKTDNNITVTILGGEDSYSK